MATRKRTVSFGKQLRNIVEEKENTVRNDPDFIELVKKLKQFCLEAAKSGNRGTFLEYPFFDNYKQFKEQLAITFKDCKIHYHFDGISVRWN